MKYKIQKNSAFTIIELMVAVGILMVVLSFSSVIFKASINSHRIAMANAEIMQKLRAITNQLNADFRGLNKDGEIFVVWKAEPATDPDYKDNDLDGYERFDCIMFFADGDFQSYNAYGSPPEIIRGNTARICYSLARKGNLRAESQKSNERILARTQHILIDTDDEELDDIFDSENVTGAQWKQWNNQYEYDKISLEKWKVLPFQKKINALSVIADVKLIYTGNEDAVDNDFWGTFVDLADPDSIHNLLCEGVAEFKIQGWSESLQRWIPEVNPDGDPEGDLTDTHFYFNESNVIPGVLYPGPFYCGVSMNNLDDLGYEDGYYPYDEIDKEHFNAIPGLGRAFKFTFTLYDSKGLIKEGRTFTHIVYLDD